MQKLLTSFSKNISIYAIFSDQNFNDTLTNDIVSFEQLFPDVQYLSPVYIYQFTLNNSSLTILHWASLHSW